MAFATGRDVMNVIQNVIYNLWKTMLPNEINTLPLPIPEMTYTAAMSKYGSDKPDTRLSMEISDVTHLLPVDLVSKITSDHTSTVEALVLQPYDSDPKKSLDFISSFMDSPESRPFQSNPAGAPGVFIIDSRKPLSGLQPLGFEAAEVLEEQLELVDGSILILQARPNLPHAGGSTPLGNLRLALHRAAVANSMVPKPEGWAFHWITGFPLFTPSKLSGEGEGQGGNKGLSSTHHPFTSPATAEDVDHILHNPLLARGDHYDLVLNGVELGGGSRRIHSAAVQKFVLKEVLGVNEKRMKDFEHLIEALRAGCPPHAGFALGLDRLVAVMLGKESIRDVIAFPKSGKGEDLLVRSPTEIKKETWDTYHLEVKK
jgi:aspartyl-tRNA synthetase